MRFAQVFSIVFMNSKSKKKITFKTVHLTVITDPDAAFPLIYFPIKFSSSLLSLKAMLSI